MYLDLVDSEKGCDNVRNDRNDSGSVGPSVRCGSDSVVEGRND